MEEIKRTEAESVAAIVRRHIKPYTKTVEDPTGQKAEILLVPEGFKPESIKRFADEYLKRPRRRTGTAQLADLVSFVQHANRFKDAGSAIFADPDPEHPRLLSVLDYHEGGCEEEGGQRFGTHRGQYDFPLSEEWEAWTAKDGEQMGQQAFAEFIENRIADIAEPSTAADMAKRFAERLGCTFAGVTRLVELSRGLSIRVGAQLRQHTNLGTGEAQLQYVSEHQDERGAALKIPGAFLIAIPVFRLGEFYQVAVRLRYRVQGAAVMWFYEIYRDDLVFNHAFRAACTTAQKETGLALFLGKPEV